MIFYSGNLPIENKTIQQDCTLTVQVRQNFTEERRMKIHAGV
jgi:hypothetical protein